MRKYLCLTLLLAVTGTVAISALAAGPAVASAATTYYVSPSGSDSNSGTSTATPWKTIAKVNATTLTAGQSIAFQGGQTFTGELIPNGSGTSGNPITYGSYGTGKAILMSSAAYGVVMVSDHDYVFTNLIIDGTNLSAGGPSACFVSGVAGSGVQRLTLDAMEIRNCAPTADGVGIAGNSALDQNWTIQNSYIHNTSDSGLILSAPGHGSDAGGMVIQNNQIEFVGTRDGNCGLGFGAHGIYGDSTGLVVQNNDIGNFSCDEGQAVSARYGGLLMQGNTIHDGTEALEYFNESTSETDGQLTSTVRYNRIYNMCAAGGSCEAGYGLLIEGEADHGSLQGPVNWNIYNNTFYSPNARGTAILIGSDAGTTDRIQNNVVYGSWGLGQYKNIGSSATIIENHNDWAANGTAPSGTGDITSAPDLSASPNFVPQTGSPVINAGTTSVTGVTFTNLCNGAILDYCQSNQDMGAKEAPGTSPPPPPPVPAPTVPTAPSGVSVTAASGQLVIAWSANSAGDVVTHYNVYRSDRTGAAEATPTSNTFTDATVVAGTQFCYQVSATNASGESAKSAQVCGTVPSQAAVAAVPAVPKGLTPVAGDAQVTMTWAPNASADNVIRYNVYRTDQTFTGPWASMTITSFTNKALVVNGTQYCYQVSATNATGESAESAPACATPEAPAASLARPGIPAGLTAQPGNASVILTWDASPAGDQVQHYNVYRTDQAASVPWISPTAPTATNSSGVVNGTQYCYQVSATNATGEGTKSAQVCATPEAPMATSAPVLTLTGTTVTWKALAGVTSYKLATINNPTTTRNTTYQLVTGTSFTPPAVPGQKVNYGLQANVANAPWATEVTINWPAALPTAPVLTLAGTTLTWKAVAGATSYKLATITNPTTTRNTTYQTVTGTSFTPPAVPGQKVNYGLSVNVANAPWAAVEVTINWPAK